MPTSAILPNNSAALIWIRASLLSNSSISLFVTIIRIWSACSMTLWSYSSTIALNRRAPAGVDTAKSEGFSFGPSSRAWFSNLVWASMASSSENAMSLIPWRARISCAVLAAALTSCSWDTTSSAFMDLRIMCGSYNLTWSNWCFVVIRHCAHEIAVLSSG